MQFLLWDAQRRAGISDEVKSQLRWKKAESEHGAPSGLEPKDGEPRLHIKEQSRAGEK